VEKNDRKKRCEIVYLSLEKDLTELVIYVYKNPHELAVAGIPKLHM